MNLEMTHTAKSSYTEKKWAVEHLKSKDIRDRDPEETTERVRPVDLDKPRRSRRHNLASTLLNLGEVDGPSPQEPGGGIRDEKDGPPGVTV